MPKGPHNQERRAFIEDDLKLTTSAGRVIGLYDLAADAEEKNDLKADEARLAEIQKQKAAFMVHLKPLAAR